VTDPIRALIRDVPDHPRPGILFKDITPLLGNSAAFRLACERMAAPFAGAGVTHVIAIESRGFLFGGVIAATLGAALVPVRKPGKLPAARSREEYELEYGTDALEMHSDAVGSGDRALIVDDVLATGGTAAATCRLVARHGASIAGCAFLIELTFLSGREALRGIHVESVLTY
jgi:adenine phosphoribosyltransferase